MSFKFNPFTGELDFSATSIWGEITGTLSDQADLQSALDGKADVVHTHIAANITDFDTEVSNNTDVAANTAVRHTHSNKALLDTYTQTEVDLADAVAKKHTQNTDTSLDLGGVNPVTAADLRAHLDNPNAHDASEIDTDTTNFNNNLSVTDIDVQTALETLDDVLGGAGTKSGSFTGDGTTSMPITGVGFKPKYLKIWTRVTVDGTNITAFETTDVILDDNAAGGAYKILGAGVHSFETNHIKSLDVDGFTVSDNGADNHPNKLNQVYNYFAIK